MAYSYVLIDALLGRPRIYAGRTSADFLVLTTVGFALLGLVPQLAKNYVDKPRQGAASQISLRATRS